MTVPHSSPFGRIIDALVEVDSARLAPLYLNDAEFHAALETVARFLPVIVGAIADECARAANARRLAQTIAEDVIDFTTLHWRRTPGNLGRVGAEPGYAAAMPDGCGTFWMPARMFEANPALVAAFERAELDLPDIG
jgi:hypothetical protein